MECNGRIPDYDLLCTENREFLYEEGIPPGVNPDLVIGDRTFAPANMAETKFQNSTLVAPSQQNVASRKRKRNAVKDKLRTEAEQNAFKKLKQIIPSLRGVKRVTKLETIRQACFYIELLQETLKGIRD